MIKFRTDCEFCESKNSLILFVEENKDNLSINLPVLFYRCTECEIEYGDSVTTWTNKIAKMLERK